MTSYYFAGRYSRHAELSRYRSELTALIPSATVTSRWIDCHDGELESSYTSEALNADPASCWRHGQNDIIDLFRADAIVSFTGNGGGGKGGRHIEHGIAIGFVENDRMPPFRLIVVGPREHIFHCHPATEVYATWNDFLMHEFEAHGAELVRHLHPSLLAEDGAS
jgi:hypothetical protein